MSEIPATSLSDPEAYLALKKFSSKIICPRTKLPVSYADVGDPYGIPLVYLLPSGCSRWLAAAQDPLCQRYGIRLIAMDRPGCGATPVVPLNDRITKSCEMIVSVLEHLRVQPAHLLVSSGGIYYALHLLIHHPSAFLTGLNPPPNLYMVAPWSPPLPPDHPNYYNQPLDWIPNTLLTTQNITMPYVIPAVKTIESVYNTASAAFRSFKSSWRDTLASHLVAPSVPPDLGGVAVPEVQDIQDATPKSTPLWAPGAQQLPVDYLYAENFEGIGQEHMICLNRGPSSTGSEWLEAVIAALSTNLRARPSGIDKIRVDVWWGWKDGMVPRKGQEWFNGVWETQPDVIDYQVHNVEDGDHSDLMQRRAGIYEVYDMIRERGLGLREIPV